MLTLALALRCSACAAAHRGRRAASAHSTVGARSSLARVRRAACSGPWRARVGYARPLGAPPRGRRHDAARAPSRSARPSTGSTRTPACASRYHRLRCGDWWDEDPRSPGLQPLPPRRRAAPTPPFGGGSEALWQATVAYRELAVIEYNVAPAVPGRGSAIFLHDDRGHATNGCVSLPRPQLLELLRRLRPGATISITVAS